MKVLSFFDIYFSLSVSLTVSLNVFYDAFLLWGLQKTFMGVHALGSQTLFYIPVRFLLFFTALSSRLLSASLPLSSLSLSPVQRHWKISLLLEAASVLLIMRN